MARPIKFRAWDGEKMLYSEEGHSFVFDEKGFTYVARKEASTIVRTLGQKPVMQFTGLHNKTGTEIWEGDIVQWDDQDFRKKTGPMLLKAEVVFYWGSFRVEGKIPGDWKGCLPPPSIDLTLGQMHRICELLGNIHENPELLK